MPFSLGASPAPVILRSVLLAKGLTSKFWVLDLLGLNGIGVLGLEDKNWHKVSVFGVRGLEAERSVKLTELAALSSAVRDAWTTSSCMPTPQTFWFALPLAVHSMYVAAFTSFPSPMACSL